MTATVRNIRETIHNTMAEKPQLLGAVLMGGASILTAVLSRALAPTPQEGKTRIWYDTLKKPAFTPPKRAFGPAWGALYVSSAYAAWRVWNTPASPERTKALSAWTSHLGFNAVWSKLFFGDHKAAASLSDITADLALASAFTFYAGKIDRVAGVCAFPLAAWLALATALNEEMVRKNRSAFS